jgi:hypothetical protein
MVDVLNFYLFIYSPTPPPQPNPTQPNPTQPNPNGQDSKDSEPHNIILIVIFQWLADTSQIPKKKSRQLVGHIYNTHSVIIFFWGLFFSTTFGFFYKFFTTHRRLESTLFPLSRIVSAPDMHFWKKNLS